MNEKAKSVSNKVNFMSIAKGTYRKVLRIRAISIRNVTVSHQNVCVGSLYVRITAKLISMKVSIYTASRNVVLCNGSVHIASRVCTV